MTMKFVPEQTEKYKALKTAEVAKSLARKENIELTDEQLEEVAGGASMPSIFGNTMRDTVFDQKNNIDNPTPTYQKLF